jgi:uncharacterized protein YecE (DUF72 family)
MLKLRNARQPLANFLASGLLELGPKLGPILWQFPPQLRFDHARFADFFDLLPRTHAQAAKLAREHDPRLDGRATTTVCKGTPARTPLRHAVEIRDESFAVPAFIDLLREKNIGLVVADTVAWPLLVDVTADFVYCRLHGSKELYASGYEDDDIDLWADRVIAWATGIQAQGRCAHPTCAPKQPRDVYIYFDNDAKVRAPFDAAALLKKINSRLTFSTPPTIREPIDSPDSRHLTSAHGTRAHSIAGGKTPADRPGLRNDRRRSPRRDRRGSVSER